MFTTFRSIRKAAALTCSSLLVRSNKHAPTRGHLAVVIGEVLEKLLIVGIADPGEYNLPINAPSNASYTMCKWSLTKIHVKQIPQSGKQCYLVSIHDLIITWPKQRTYDRSLLP